jgi:hypothetical protein
LAALVAVRGVILAARAGAWRKVLSYAVLPAAVLAAALEPWAFVHFCNGLGNMLHFEVMRSQYLSQIRAMPDSAGPKLVVFDWGGMSWASNGVVYDESDEVALPLEQQSSGWHMRASRTELGCGGYSIRPMGGHFYLADFPC